MTTDSEEIKVLRKMLAMVFRWLPWGAAVGALSEDPVMKRALAENPVQSESEGRDG